MSNLHDLPDCTYRLLWSPEDGEYVGLCGEFPSLSWLAATQQEALEGIRALVSDVVDDMAGNDEPAVAGPWG